jgi:endonuclease/exonuclease/phosphatase (EEP) superfamily protein YafD
MLRRHSALTTRRLAAAALLGGAAAGVILPERLGIGDRFPFAAAVSWRPQAAVSALAAAAVLAVRPGTRASAVAVGAVALAGVGSVAGRAIGRTAPGSGGLTVLAFNALEGRADTGELATVIEREAPHFVVLPEAGPDFRDKLMSLVEIMGYRSWVSTGPRGRNGEGVTLLAAASAGDVQVRSASAMQLQHLEATGGILGGRTLYAAHAFAPVGRWRTGTWLNDLEALGRWTASEPAPIVVGDFNATLDHDAFRRAFGRCRSAAAGTGQGLVGTFPAGLPRRLGIQIDHVLVPVEALTTRFEVVDIAGSDHRAVLTTLGMPQEGALDQADAAAEGKGSSISI